MGMLLYLSGDTPEEVEHSEWIEYLLGLSYVRGQVLVLISSCL